MAALNWPHDDLASTQSPLYSETMLSLATAALSFSAPVSKTFDSKVAAAGAAAALSLVAMPVRFRPSHCLHCHAFRPCAW